MCEVEHRRERFKRRRKLRRHVALRTRNTGRSPAKIIQSPFSQTGLVLVAAGWASNHTTAARRTSVGKSFPRIADLRSVDELRQAFNAAGARESARAWISIWAPGLAPGLHAVPHLGSRQGLGSRTQ